MVDFTVVLGVDKKHLEQLKMVWPTWKKHKPNISAAPMVIFTDDISLSSDILHLLGFHVNVVPWPSARFSSSYPPGNGDKWTSPQRVKMLSGFVYVAAEHVITPYWLKLDTDVVATGNPDWIDESWFDSNPAIVSHPWGFSRPPTIIDDLDQWVFRQPTPDLAARPPLDLHPVVGEDRVRHKRIISWCGFFNTQFTRDCADYAQSTCGYGRLPVPSQDTYQFYVAERLGLPIVRTSFKNRGFEQWMTMENVRKAVARSMADA